MSQKFWKSLFKKFFRETSSFCEKTDVLFDFAERVPEEDVLAGCASCVAVVTGVDDVPITCSFITSRFWILLIPIETPTECTLWNLHSFSDLIQRQALGPQPLGLGLLLAHRFLGRIATTFVLMRFRHMHNGVFVLRHSRSADAILEVCDLLQILLESVWIMLSPGIEPLYG